MSDSVLYLLLYLFGVLLAAFAQILLKTSANQNHRNILKEYLNSRVVCGYTLFLLSTVCSLLAFRRLPLSVGAVLGAAGYVIVPALSALIFRETLSRRKILGLAIVVVGIITISFS